MKTPATSRPAPPTPKTDAGGDSRLEQTIGAAMRITYRAMIQELQFYVAPYDIPVAMCFFLRALGEEEGLSQRELSERVGSADPTTVEQLQAMTKRGFIERRRSKEDGRKMLVYLTPRGRAMTRDVVGFAREVSKAALAGLSEGEIGFLRLALERMRANMEARRAARDEAAAAARPRARKTKSR